MQRYILRRLLLTVPALLGVTLIVSAMVRLLPGDAVTMMMQDYGSYARDADDLRAQVRLDAGVLELLDHQLDALVEGVPVGVEAGDDRHL